ncbi:MAG TPA: SUF system Fe-S cluster assembly regulator [Gammaproteobacteria bacterium]|nr:SUF system Fe-S cluster assembly regulator [Gammaproteobacteria bacterium]
MLRLSKLTDYGTVLLAELAQEPASLRSAAELAEKTRLALPTVSKLLKLLTRGGLVNSTRGAQGGYTLARDPGAISAVQIIDAIEGPVAITECSSDHSNCNLQANCGVGTNWQRINIAIREALQDIKLAQLARPVTQTNRAIKINLNSIKHTSTR